MSVLITDPNGYEQEYIMEYISNSNPTSFSLRIQLLVSGSYFYRYKAVDAYTTKWHPGSGKIIGPTVHEEHILEIDKSVITPSFALAGNEITYFAQIQNEIGIATMSVFVTSPDGNEKEYLMLYNKDSNPTSFSKTIVLSSPGNYLYRFKATDDNYTIWEPKSGKECKTISIVEPEIISNDIIFTPYYPESDAIASSVMPGGKVKRYYVISGTDREPVASMVVNYKFNENDTIYKAQTDKQGRICIETPSITHSKNFQLSVTDSDGNFLTDQAILEPCFDVFVRDKSYSITYSIYFGIGGSIGPGGGIKIGPFKFKKLDTSLNAGLNISTHLAFDINGNKTDLILTNKRGVEGGFNILVGLFGKTWSTTLTKPSVKSGLDVGTTVKGNFLSKYKFQS